MSTVETRHPLAYAYGMGAAGLYAGACAVIAIDALVKAQGGAGFILPFLSAMGGISIFLVLVFSMCRTRFWAATFCIVTALIVAIFLGVVVTL